MPRQLDALSVQVHRSHAEYAPRGARTPSAPDSRASPSQTPPHVYWVPQAVQMKAGMRYSDKRSADRRLLF